MGSIESIPTPPHHITSSHHHPSHSFPPPSSSLSSHHTPHHLPPSSHHHPSPHVHPNSLLDSNLIKGLTSSTTGVNCLSLSSLPTKPPYPLPVSILNGSSSSTTTSSSVSSRLCPPTGNSSAPNNNNTHQQGPPPLQPPHPSNLCLSSGGGKSFNGINPHLTPADFRSSFVDLMSWSSGGGGSGSMKVSSSSAHPPSSSWSLPYGCVFWPRSPATAAVAAAAAAAAAVSTGSSVANRLPSDLLYPVMDTTVTATASSSSTGSKGSSSNSTHLHSPHLSDSSPHLHHPHHPHHPAHWLMPIEAAASSSFLLTSAAAAASVSQNRSLIESNSSFNANGQGPLVAHLSAFKPINITTKSSLLSSKHNNSNNQSISSSTIKDSDQQSTSSPNNPMTITPTSSIVDDIDDVIEPTVRSSPINPSDNEADLIDVIGEGEDDEDDDNNKNQVNCNIAISMCGDNNQEGIKSGKIITEDDPDNHKNNNLDCRPNARKRNRVILNRTKKNYLDSNELIKKEQLSIPINKQANWTRQEMIEKINANQKDHANNNYEVSK